MRIKRDRETVVPHITPEQQMLIAIDKQIEEIRTKVAEQEKFNSINYIERSINEQLSIFKLAIQELFEYVKNVEVATDPCAYSEDQELSAKEAELAKLKVQYHLNNIG